MTTASASLSRITILKILCNRNWLDRKRLTEGVDGTVNVCDDGKEEVL